MSPYRRSLVDTVTPDSLHSIKKSLVAAVMSIFALIAHFDPGFSDNLGDVLLYIDLGLAPIFVWATRNAPPEGPYTPPAR